MPTINERIAEEKAKQLEKPKSTRERSCGCIKCFKRQTWNDDAICDGCREK